MRKCHRQGEFVLVRVGEKTQRFLNETLFWARVASFSTFPLVHEKYSVRRREIHHGNWVNVFAHEKISLSRRVDAHQGRWANLMRGGGVVKVIVFSNYYFSHENISLSRVTSFSTCPLVHEKYSVSRREIYGLMAATGTSWNWSLLLIQRNLLVSSLNLNHCLI